MRHELEDLALRLENLERENKKLKRAGAALACAAGVLGLLGMAAPALCDIVNAERLVLRDPSGHQRLVVDAYQSESPTLTWMGRDGRNVARLGVAENGEAYFDVFDKQGGSKSIWRVAPDAAPKTEKRPEPADTKKTDAATIAAE